MKETRLIMGMPVALEVVGDGLKEQMEIAFDYFTYVDEKFSTYKEGSEISRINRGEIAEAEYSEEMREIIRLSDETKKITNGYFDITKPDGSLDPSGIVKGWAITNAARLLDTLGVKNFYVDAGGDIEARGLSSEGNVWKAGIRDPFSDDAQKIVKAVRLLNSGIATSGTYIRGDHIYDPHGKISQEIVSFTVLGPNAYEADRFATAAFAMGKEGIHFIDRLEGFEGYMIDSEGIATETRGFADHVIQNNA